MKKVRKNSKAKKINTENKQTAPLLNESLSIIDLIMIDHRALKNCIKILKSEVESKNQKLEASKVFLKVLKAHTESEEKYLYEKFKHNKEAHFHILEGFEEHHVADAQMKTLTPKISKTRSFTETLEAKMKVLAEIVEHHLKEEENELLPIIKDEAPSEELDKLGALYLKDRDFTEDELNTLYEKMDLSEEITQLKESVIDLSHKFKQRAENYIESLKKQ